MASIIKDTGEIWSRLFDHRPFVQGEITFFLREFQEKRADREVERLFKILEYATELKESQLDRTEQLGDCHLPSLKANVDVALSMCNRVLQREENFDSDSVLNGNRLVRRKEWEKFVNDMSDKCQKVDQTFQEKESEIQEFYVDLEKKKTLHRIHTNMPVGSIVDPAVKIKPAIKLIDFIIKNVKNTDNMPIGIVSLIKSKKSKKEIANATLKIEDLRWLDRYLREYRKTATKKIYLHELLDNSDVILPSPEITPRNPELEARIKKLKAQQNAREYQAMTKSIDSVRKFLPEDSIAYQMKQINKQLIAVAQFIFSVIAGFAFGFIGIELLFGNLDFGFRLLLGIICALIIALAEIYFLALKLNEYDFDVLATAKTKKLHQD